MVKKTKVSLKKKAEIVAWLHKIAEAIKQAGVEPITMGEAKALVSVVFHVDEETASGVVVRAFFDLPKKTTPKARGVWGAGREHNLW